MMVSNVQDSAPAPPLSYADRVKKSQRKGSPASGSAQRPQARTQPSSSISAPSSTRGVAKPPADGSSARPQEAATATDCTIPPLLNSTRTSFANPINGEANLNVQALAAAPSSSTGKKAAVPPKANVWTQRTEKMTKVLSQQTSRATDVPAQPLPSSDDASHTGVAAASPSQAPTIPPTVKEVDPVVGEVTSAPNAADIRISAEDDEDAWVVRPHLAPTAVPLPALDASSWPEVGQAPSGDAVSSSQTANSGGEPENKAKKETQGSGTKRGEKQRWVPIPAEELRAAADAHRSAQASHSRSQSQQSSRNRGQNSASGSAGRSKNASLERSKIQPSGNRDRPSASQSEMHSRAGSMQSSPRHVPTRLRRPPDDVGGSSSRKSSRATSPRPYSSTSVPTATGAVELPQGPGHQHEGVNGTVYYPGIPRTHVPSAYSATPPYPPPPGAVPITFNPAYPYAPYPYGAPPGQPYPMFWPAIHQDPRHQYAMSSQSQSPATHPSSLTRSDDVSPPTSASPSPTEERTEVSVVPVHAGAMSVSSDAQKSAAENKPSRGRQRILSFGSIRADGKIVGDEGGADATEIATADMEKSSSLGLDVGSLSVNDNADVTPRNGERPTFKLNAETPAFSIRVARRDPSMSKESTAAVVMFNGPQTIGASTSTPEIINGDEKNFSTSTSETTWEFGSTRQVPDAQETRSTGEARTQPEATTSEGAANTSDLAAPDTIPLRVRLSPLGVNAEGLPPTPIPPSAGPALYANNNPLSFENSSREDEWRVRDFGYGFGRSRPDGTYGPREDRPPKDRSYYAGRSAPRSYEPEGFRRGFGGRRARGGPRGYGRGGRYRGSFPRYPLRDAEEYDLEEGYAYGVPDTSVYFLPPPVPALGYMPPAFDPAYGYPAGYPLPPVLPAPPATQPAMPVPAPLTKLSFPLDPIRYYLLGQLEYYLSEDNMAQDLYLRKQMDSHGWIPSHLFASFPRVKILTYDFHLVIDVLAMSSLAEVKGDFVRPHKWSRYVLPDAKASTVDGGAALQIDTSSSSQVYVGQLLLQDPPLNADADASRAATPPQSPPQAIAEHSHVLAAVNHVRDDAAEDVQEYEDEDEDDEEDDVVFVL